MQILSKLVLWKTVSKLACTIENMDKYDNELSWHNVNLEKKQLT